MRKGQGLSLNTIIIAAIVLIVLIVLWAIFTGRMGSFTTGVKECRGLEGDPEKGCGAGYVNIPGTNYDYCCVELEVGEEATIKDAEELP